MHQTWTVWLFGNDLHACGWMLSGLDRTAACTLMIVRPPNLWLNIECVGYHCILKMSFKQCNVFLGNHTCNARQFSAYFVACDTMDLQVNMLWCQWDVRCSVFDVIFCQPATSVVFAGHYCSVQRVLWTSLMADAAYNWHRACVWYCRGFSQHLVTKGSVLLSKPVW